MRGRKGGDPRRRPRGWPARDRQHARKHHSRFIARHAPRSRMQGLRSSGRRGQGPRHPRREGGRDVPEVHVQVRQVRPRPVLQRPRDVLDRVRGRARERTTDVGDFLPRGCTVDGARQAVAMDLSFRLGLRGHLLRRSFVPRGPLTPPPSPRSHRSLEGDPANNGDDRDDEPITSSTDRIGRRRRLLGGLRIEFQSRERRRRIPIFERRERIGVEQQFWVERRGGGQRR